MLNMMAGLVADALPAWTSRKSIPAGANATPSVRACEQWDERTHVLGSELFTSVLARERKRADRFDYALLLAVVRMNEGPLDRWHSIVTALAASRRETDVLGWLEQGSAVALLLPDIRPSDENLAGQIDRRVRAQLASRIDTAALRGVSVQVCTHLPRRYSKETGLREDDLPVRPEPASSSSRTTVVLKRALDVAGSAALLLFLAPVFALVAALVKLTSPGPALFRQVRVGHRGKPFDVLKFRTMRVNSDAVIHQDYVSAYIKGCAQQNDGGNGKVFKLTHDPRITPVGSFLRKTSLDELPQLWNVLRGDMSLVGPRPPIPYEVVQYKPWHCRRVLEAKPGITGLWQVNGRSRTTFDEMVRLDLRYARMCSLWTDIKILLATPRAVIAGKGGY